MAKLLSGRVRMGTVETEPIGPTEIVHSVDDTGFGDEHDQHYNYLDYHFEDADAYCRARAYIEGMHTVSVFGPLKRRDDLVPVDAPEFYGKVLDYLKKRYSVITTLGEAGYVTLWEAKKRQ